MVHLVKNVCPHKSKYKPTTWAVEFVLVAHCSNDKVPDAVFLCLSNTLTSLGMTTLMRPSGLYIYRVETLDSASITVEPH